MGKKIVEKHITVTEETKKKVEKMAKKQRRSQREVVTKLVDDAYKEGDYDV